MSGRPLLRLCVLAWLAAWGATPAAAANPPDLATLKNTYMFGLKCYVANAVAVSDSRYNADGSHSAAFKASGQKSYDTIWYMGRKIGNSEALIQEDIDSYERLLRDTYLHDDAFFQRVRGECAQIGLM